MAMFDGGHDELAGVAATTNSPAWRPPPAVGSAIRRTEVRSRRATRRRNVATRGRQGSGSRAHWAGAAEAPPPRRRRLLRPGPGELHNFLMDIILRECGDAFLGINSLIDVAGGHGGAARAITKAFPQMKCSVLDLPHVVAEAPTDEHVLFISGDMFKHIPAADALFLKSVFHDWGDEDCVKILKKCKEAIPPREAGGKVIIVDMVVGSGPNEIVTRETQVLFDLFIMCFEGIEREEFKWKNIFMEAGFSNYKIIAVMGVRSVIELYP